MKSMHIQKQRGAVLIFSLIFLLVMSLIGITGMQVTGLEEKMASNTRDLNTALQAAEVGLRAGESFLYDLVTVSSFDGETASYMSSTDDEPDYMDSSVWSDGVTYSGDFMGVASQPKYLIKLVGEEDPDTNANLNIGGYKDNLAGGAVTIFRVTARGTGGSDNAVVILQTHYGKRF